MPTACDHCGNLVARRSQVRDPRLLSRIAMVCAECKEVCTAEKRMGLKQSTICRNIDNYAMTLQRHLKRAEQEASQREARYRNVMFRRTGDPQYLPSVPSGAVGKDGMKPRQRRTKYSRKNTPRRRKSTKRYGSTKNKKRTSRKTRTARKSEKKKSTLSRGRTKRHVSSDRSRSQGKRKQL